MTEWTQLDATTWQMGHWQISFGEFSGVYSVCWFDDEGAIGHAAFDELADAKRYCVNANIDWDINQLLKEVGIIPADRQAFKDLMAEIPYADKATQDEAYRMIRERKG